MRPPGMARVFGPINIIHLRRFLHDLLIPLTICKEESRNAVLSNLLNEYYNLLYSNISDNKTVVNVDDLLFNRGLKIWGRESLNGFELLGLYTIIGDSPLLNDDRRISALCLSVVTCSTTNEYAFKMLCDLITEKSSTLAMIKHKREELTNLGSIDISLYYIPDKLGFSLYRVTFSKQRMLAALKYEFATLKKYISSLKSIAEELNEAL